MSAWVAVEILLELAIVVKLVGRWYRDERRFGSGRLVSKMTEQAAEIELELKEHDPAV